MPSLFKNSASNFPQFSRSFCCILQVCEFWSYRLFLLYMDPSSMDDLLCKQILDQTLKSEVSKYIWIQCGVLDSHTEAQSNFSAFYVYDNCYFILHVQRELRWRCWNVFSSSSWSLCRLSILLMSKTSTSLIFPQKRAQRNLLPPNWPNLTLFRSGGGAIICAQLPRCIGLLMPFRMDPKWFHNSS